jgi:hypothetical protein
LNTTRSQRGHGSEIRFAPSDSRSMAVHGLICSLQEFRWGSHSRGRAVPRCRVLIRRCGLLSIAGWLACVVPGRGESWGMAFLAGRSAGLAGGVAVQPDAASVPLIVGLHQSLWTHLSATVMGCCSVCAVVVQRSGGVWAKRRRARLSSVSPSVPPRLTGMSSAAVLSPLFLLLPCSRLLILRLLACFLALRRALVL